jgi:hypothetical protein
MGWLLGAGLLLSGQRTVLIHQPLDDRVYRLYGEWLRLFSIAGPSFYGAPIENVTEVVDGAVLGLDGGTNGRTTFWKKAGSWGVPSSVPSTCSPGGCELGDMEASPNHAQFGCCSAHNSKGRCKNERVRVDSCSLVVPCITMEGRWSG